MNGLRKTLTLLGVGRNEVSNDIDFDVAVPDEYVNKEGLVYLIAWNAGGDSIAVQAQIGKKPNGVRWIVRGSVGGSPDPYSIESGVKDYRKTVEEGVKIAGNFLREGHF